MTTSKTARTSSENVIWCFSSLLSIVLQVAWATKRWYTILEFNWYELGDKKKKKLTFFVKYSRRPLDYKTSHLRPLSARERL